MMTPRYGSNQESKSARAEARRASPSDAAPAPRSLENFVNPDAVLRAGQNRTAGVEADQRLDLFANPLRLGRRQVEFLLITE